MKIIYSIMALLFLAGCQSHLRGYEADIAKQMKTVEEAQAQVDAKSAKCTKGKQLMSLPPKEYLKGVKCRMKLIEEIVVPVSPYPAPLKKFLYTNLETASLYSQGKITFEQLESRIKLAGLELETENNRLYNEARQYFAGRDAEANASVARALQGFEPVRPVYTSCSTFGSTTQCHTQ